MRDFRDAKAMAHSLREALQAKSVQTTHGECLELIAKAFGYDNWNILAAKIEAVREPAPQASAHASSAAPDQVMQKTLCCSFCGKTQHDVRALIAGPAVFVCDECVGACNDVLADREVWELLKADEESGRGDYPEAFDWVRAKTAEEVAAFVERSKGGVERQRLALRDVQRVLALRNSKAEAANDELASPRLAHLSSRATEDLAVIEQQARRHVKRYEDMLRLATVVLDERRTT
jgi:hypothetical protein